MRRRPPGGRARAAIVTGSASGLGRALVDVLRGQGWRVAGLDLAETDADLSMHVDVTDPGAVTTAVERTVAELGGIDATVSCAGIYGQTLTPVHLMDDSAWVVPLAVNLTGSFHLSRATLPHLTKSSGTLVLVASTAAEHPQPGGAAYAASKAGVRSLARSIALEYARSGVRACSVSPGYLRTAMTERVLRHEQLRSAIEAATPIGRIGDPAEAADVIAFLVSDGARFLTGQDVVVDGGRSLTAYAGPSDVDEMWSHRAQS